MADRATEQTMIDAPPRLCYGVVLDFERYPDWAQDIKEVAVLERDDQGRGLDVRFRAGGMGHSASYTLRYDYTNAPVRLAWRQIAGDITRRLDGHYDFLPVDGEPDRTDVHYLLEVDLIVPLPNFIKRRAEVKLVHTALQDLKERVERGDGG